MRIFRAAVSKKSQVPRPATGKGSDNPCSEAQCSHSPLLFLIEERLCHVSVPVIFHRPPPIRLAAHEKSHLPPDRLLFGEGEAGPLGFEVPCRSGQERNFCRAGIVL